MALDSLKIETKDLRARDPGSIRRHRYCLSSPQDEVFQQMQNAKNQIICGVKGSSFIYTIAKIEFSKLPRFNHTSYHRPHGNSHQTS